MVPLALLVLGALAAAVAPRVLARSSWPEREPVLGLWMWQCVVAAVLLCCVLVMALSGAAAWDAVRARRVLLPADRCIQMVRTPRSGRAGPWARAP